MLVGVSRGTCKSGHRAGWDHYIFDAASIKQQSLQDAAPQMIDLLDIAPLLGAEAHNQGFTPLPFLAHLDVEYHCLVHETGDDVHPVNVAVLGRPFHIVSPNLG